MSPSNENSDRFYFLFSKKSQYSVQTMRVWTDSCKLRRRVSCLGRLVAPHPPNPYDFHCFVNADWKVAFHSIVLSFMNKIITMHVHVTLIREWKNLYRAFSLTWPASLPIYWDQKKARLDKKGVQLLQDWFGTPAWRPFRCFGALTGTLRSDNGNANEKVAEK